ncbi:hypothetical protein ACQUSR_19690 [Streptomyces sp. P1-3]|uniref:hypothetical protein n=1 Tax=Streptomyces sp. P1-3 TaxID=3421658 RepID=UPI003D36118C
MTPTPPHHHAYLWVGNGRALVNDGPRRPVHPDFRTADVPPLERAHWLLKPATRIAGTFAPHDAADWYGAQLAQYADAITGTRGPAPDRAETIRGLRAGDDIVGGWWLTGDRFLSLSLIACPHRVRPEFPCPQR